MNIDCSYCQRQAKWIGHYGEFRLYKCECGEEIQTRDGISPFGVIYKLPPLLSFVRFFCKSIIEEFMELHSFK